MSNGQFWSDGSAIISSCGQYRYMLERKGLTASDRLATFVMLNPSTADAQQDDATIRRCKGFARSWGCGRLVVVNLFAFRATKPSDMKAAADPVGPDNDRAIYQAADEAANTGGKIVCAWGAHGSFKDRDKVVLAILGRFLIEPVSLGENGDGSPKHPLYLPSDAKPLAYRGRYDARTSGRRAA
jgi:hypothetical protein